MSSQEAALNASNESFSDTMNELDRLSALYSSHLADTSIQPFPKLTYQLSHSSQ